MRFCTEDSQEYRSGRRHPTSPFFDPRDAWRIGIGDPDSPTHAHSCENASLESPNLRGLASQGQRIRKTLYMTLRYASDRELRRLAVEGSIERTHATGLLVASAIFILLGVYGLAFSAIYDVGLIPLLILSLASVVTGLGVFLGRRFALWLSLLLFPLAIVETLSTLFYSVTMSGWYSSDMVTLFNASLIMYVIGLVVALLLVIDKRSELK